MDDELGIMSYKLIQTHNSEFIIYNSNEIYGHKKKSYSKDV